MKSTLKLLISSYCLLCGSSWALAQSSPPHKISAAPKEISSQNELEVWLRKKANLPIALQKTDSLFTPWSSHIHYKWLYQDMPIYHGKVVWNIKTNSSATVSFPVMPYHLNIDQRPISTEVLELFSGQLSPNESIVHSEICWVLTNLQLAQHYSVIIDKRTTVVEVLLDRNGVKVEENLMELHQKDTVVNVNLYLPDPLTSSNAVYGDEGFVDNNDEASLQLIQAMQQDTIPLAWHDTENYWHLSSRYAVAVDIDSPGVKPPQLTSLDQILVMVNRDHPHFEYFNAFYHINRAARYNASLGFTELVNYPIPFDAHGSTADQSSFVSGAIQPYLKFGDGGVDDAEDADVIVHEYGHAMSQSAAPGTNIGAERNALEEGICDYFAVSHSRRLHPGNRNTVFDWDGHNEFWGGRSFSALRTYPSTLENNLYQDGLIWASALGEIADYIGESTTDQLAIQSLYSWFATMTMIDAGRLFLQADTLINTAKNAEVISMVLCARGLLPNCEDTLILTTPLDQPYLTNTFNFAYNQSPLYLYPNGKRILSVEWFDTSGKLLYEEAVEATEDRFLTLTGEVLNPGVFILRITTNEGTFSHKIVRVWVN